MVLCRVDDVVLMTGFRVGIVRYRGTVSGHDKEIFVGVEIFMTDSNAGNTDGIYNGIRYFQCSPKRGLFINEQRIQRVITAEELLNKLVKVNEQKKQLEQENNNYEVMADLYLKKSISWKEQLKNLEIAHNEVQSEIEFLKHQFMLSEQKRMEQKHYEVNVDDIKAKHEKNNDPFHMISVDDTSGLRKYLSENQHIINAFNDPEKGNLPIWAVRCDSINAVKLLKEFGTDINQNDDIGWTPLIYCCIYNNVPMAELLLSYGSDVEGLDHGCWSPVIFCCMLHHDKMLKLLAKHDANLDRFVYANKNPLILAAERGYYKCLKILKDEDVDLMDALNIVKHSNHSLMTQINRKKSIEVLTP